LKLFLTRVFNPFKEQDSEWISKTRADLHSIYITIFKRVNHQIHPWIFKGRPNSSLNYAKYQLSSWICQMSIKKVPPSKWYVSHANLSPCMLCCLVHVARRKPRFQGLIWLNWKKVQFSLFSFFFFYFSHFAPALPIPPSSHFSQKHQKRPWPFSFPLKLSPFSPLQNHHHLQRFSMVLCFGLFVICNLKFLTCSSFWTTSTVLLLLGVKPIVMFTRVNLR